MKIIYRILAAALALMLCTCAFAEDVPGNRLGLTVLAKLADGTENKFVSPVSLALALELAAQGANGETLEALRAALGGGAEDLAALNAALTDSGLKIANAAFLKPSFVPREEYVQALRERCGAEWFPLDDIDRVNDWTKEHTDGLIEKLLEQAPSADTALMLVNAVAMEEKWAMPFDPLSTFDDTFHAPDGDVEVSFMHETDYMTYTEALGAQCLRLGYRGSSLAMVLILPEDGDVPRVLAALAEDGGQSVQFPEEETRVRLTLPRLDISTSESLKQPLTELGLAPIFAQTADFSGISEQPLFVGDVLQKVRVQIDEEGTRAAAVTSIIMAEGAMMETNPPVSMTLNRPFLMLIEDEDTGAVCFAGVVAHPQAEARTLDLEEDFEEDLLP